jgi:hypothetical protein
VTTVVNNAGGTLTPDQFTAHVRLGATDVKGSPQPGSATGTTYTLVAGSTYTMAADGVAGYGLAVTGNCAANGSITLQEGQVRTCTITADDVAPSPAPPPTVVTSQSQQLPPPQLGKNVNVLPKTGTDKVKLPGTKLFILIEEATQIPLGTIVDVTNGGVTLIAPADKNGGTAAADFYGGIFKLGQTKGSTPTTTLTLVEKLSCGSGGKASAAAAKKKKRRLWGDGSGKFQTKGKHSAATVVGTKWLVEDRCDSTLTRVVRGKVSVRDFGKRKTVIVRAGKKYVARAKR